MREPFTPAARLDEDALVELVAVAVRMMDNTIDASGFPLEAQHQEAMAKRRIGLGITGLADALMMVGLRYGSVEAAARGGTLGRTDEPGRLHCLGEVWRRRNPPSRCSSARRTWPARSVRELDAQVRALINEHGIRNALLTSIAPTGTISLLADNVSSGVEPVFAHSFTRKVTEPDGSKREEVVEDYAVRLYREKFGAEVELPDYFVTAQTLTPMEHVRMQAALQRHVDSAISKTVNVPQDIPFETFQEVYREAYRQGCKGCTTFRPNAITGSILSIAPEPANAAEAVAAAATVPVEPNHSPIPRPGKLTGSTYKLRWLDNEHAMYITINDIEEGGRRRPFEVFISRRTWSISAGSWRLRA